MRIEIKTNGRVKDPDIKALYLLDAALKMSTDRMVNANLEFAISKYKSDKKKGNTSDGREELEKENSRLFHDKFNRAKKRFDEQPSTPTEQDDEKLWDAAEDIFDTYTKPSEGGYGADYTDKWGFFNSLKQSYTIKRKGV